MRAHRVVLVVFVLFVARPQPAGAWNPLKAAANKVRQLGDALGASAGGFVESATAPTIRNAESAGRRLIRDTEDALERRVDHAGSVASRLIAETDQGLADRLAQVDRSLEARIVQVQLSADAVVDRTFGRLDRSIGRLDAIARRRIDQIAVQSKEIIDHGSDKAMAILAEADAVLIRRIEDVRRLVQTSIQEADAVAEARILQLDELAGRRIGNLDVVATKLSLNAERTMLRIASLVAMVAFIGFVLWRLFVEWGSAWKTSLVGNIGSRVRDTAMKSSPRFFTQIALAGAGAGLLWLLAGHLPKNAEERAAQQVRHHEQALDAALAAYDFTGVKYHASQLGVLRPDATVATRVIVRKADLLQTIFTRPAVLQSVGGIRQVMADIAAIEREAPGDADVLVLKAYVLWQVGATRRDEHEAATLCAEALERPSRGFMLGALAVNYLGAFLHDPYEPATDLDRLRRVHQAATAGESPEFQHVLEFNRLVAALDRASAPAYLDMLSAHADYLVARQGWKKPAPERPEMIEARERRLAAARRVVEAWRIFDEELESSPWLADDPTALAAFTLDDAVLARARYFEAVPDAAGLPPEFLGEDAQLPAVLRVKTAPLRVAWARRYAALIGSRSQDLLAFEESARFRWFEARAHAFELAYVDFLVATRNPTPPPPAELAGKAEAAALAAARIGLHRDTEHGRKSAAFLVLDAFRAAGGGDLSPELAAAIAAEAEHRRLRFL